MKLPDPKFCAKASVRLTTYFVCCYIAAVLSGGNPVSSLASSALAAVFCVALFWNWEPTSEEDDNGKH